MSLQRVSNAGTYTKVHFLWAINHTVGAYTQVFDSYAKSEENDRPDDVSAMPAAAVDSASSAHSTDM